MAWEVVDTYEVPHEPSEAVAEGFLIRNTETGETVRVEVWEYQSWDDETGELYHVLEVIWDGVVDFSTSFDPDDPADVERAKTELFERYPELKGWW